MKYKYVAFTKTGEKVTGIKKADSRDEVVNFLQSQNLIVESVEESLGVALKKILNTQIGGFSLKDKNVFAKQLVIMLESGLPLTQAIQVLKDQAPNSAMKEDLGNIYHDLQNGSPLSASFKKHSKIFNDVQINLIAAGEKSGNLVSILKKIEEDLARARNLKSKIKGALIYPAVIFVAIIVVLVIMITFMIPQVEKLYAEFGIEELPFITKFIVNISHFVTSIFGLFTIFLIIFSSIAIYFYYKSTESGKKFFHKVSLKLPVFGKLNNKIQVAEFARLLSLLLVSGVPIVDALNIVADSTSNIIYANAIRDSAKRVTKGVPLAVPLSKNGIFPVLFTKVVVVGEETGRLDQVLSEMAKFYELEATQIADSLTKLLEPFILLITAGLVAFLAIAVYWPIYSIGQYI